MTTIGVDEDVDVVVVGSGAAALAAAVTAAHAGARVVVLEAAPLLGGATAFSGGMPWVPMNRHLDEVDVADSREEALRYIRGLTQGREPDPELLEVSRPHSRPSRTRGRRADDQVGLRDPGHPGGRDRMREPQHLRERGPDQRSAPWEVGAAGGSRRERGGRRAESTKTVPPAPWAWPSADGRTDRPGFVSPPTRRRAG
jgi:glycine/D-amino acid oxidase-like deaminating enzyme